ncbi:MAG TPA: ABC transporter substrate-binding protein [Rhodopila sp.]|uniref:ABC transporter substrate-binding protein n=1 Tax=Rhodopila sp. TaxID=2480087 RepID=UPI002C1A170F|nr:ABC transporter substrate-binding protein [Rhodopila sp.]HVY15554.1 ABC transporter substrate-binding protein [Rhodopila sp.]
MKWLRLACLVLLLPFGAAAQELRMGVQSAFVVDPHVLFLGPNMAMARNLYDSFVGKDADAHWTPALAIAWKQVDPLTWEFALRHGVRFSDGSPFTADDVVASVERIPNIPGNPGPYTSNLRTITKVWAVDPYTIRVSTDRPNPLLPGQFTNVFILSKAQVHASPEDFSAAKATVGTGPFRLVSFRYGDVAVMEPNPYYWGPKPPWKRVTIRVIGNDGAREAALLAGDLDLIENVPPEDVDRLRKTPDIHVYARPADRVAFLLPNVAPDTLPLLTDKDGKALTANPLRDLKVRQAISAAIDRAALVSRALSGQGAATLQLVPEGFGGWDPAVKVPPLNTAGAKALLKQAGYPGGFGMTLACTNDRYVDDARVCQAIAQMLSRAGFAMKVDTMPGSVFFPKSRYGKNQWPLILYELSLSSLRDGQYILQVCAQTVDEKRGIGDGNRGGFSDPALDAKIEAAVVRSDPGREAAIRDALAAAVHDLGIIPMYVEPTIAATRGPVTYTPRVDQQMTAMGAAPAH